MPQKDQQEPLFDLDARSEGRAALYGEDYLRPKIATSDGIDNQKLMQCMQYLQYRK